MSSVLEFPEAPSMTAAVEQLKAASGLVASLVAAGHLEVLSESELLEVTVDLQCVASQVDAARVSTVAEVRDGDVAKSDGFTSTTRFLESKAGLSKGESRAQVALGEKLQWEFPATAQAWLAGEISEGMVQVITTAIPRKLKSLPNEDYVAKRTELEAMALRHAKTKTVSEVKRAIARAAIVADPVGAAEAAVVAKRNEFLSFVPVEDGVEVRGFLAWDTAGVVLPCFDQANDARYRSGQLAEDYSDQAELERLARTPSLRRRRREHRNAEIFAELATRLLDDGELGTKHAQRPHLTVTVHADDFAAGLGGDILLPGYGPVPVPNETIERFLCDAEIHPVLTRRPRPAPAPASASASGSRQPGDPVDPLNRGSVISEPHYPGSIPASSDPPWRPRWGPGPGGVGSQRLDPMGQDPTPEELEADTDLAAMTEFEADLDDHDSWWNRFLGEQPRHVLDVGRSRRTAPPKMRRALTIRDGGCAVPGCDVDASRCEAHHITYWEHHGETCISNMVLLCAKHHHMVHEGRWLILRNTELDPGDPGYITLVTPALRP